MSDLTRPWIGISVRGGLYIGTPWWHFALRRKETLMFSERYRLGCWVWQGLGLTLTIRWHRARAASAGKK